MTTTIATQLRTQLTKTLTQKRASLSKVQAAETQLTKEISQIENQIKKFDDVFGEPASSQAPKVKAAKVKVEPTPVRRKPGPKPKAPVMVKAAKTAGKKVVVKAKTIAAKPAKVAKPKEKKKLNNSRAAEGRREVAEGLRPAIRDAMTQVMGDKVMNATEVYEALEAKNWLPNSNAPRPYVSYLLSSLKDRFERPDGRRGYYRVKPEFVVASASTKTKAAPKSDTKVADGATPTPTPPEVVTENNDVDEVLRDAGVM